MTFAWKPLPALSLAANAMLLAGCLDDAPPTQAVEWDEEACASTEPGNACLTFRITMDADTREDAPDLTGELRWAVYRNGDVSGFGPGDNDPIYEGTMGQVDFASSNASFSDHLPNVPPTSYQVLAILDADNSGAETDDDPISFPTDGFLAPPDTRTLVDIKLDYIY